MKRKLKGKNTENIDLDKRNKNQKRVIKGLSVAVGILAASTLALGIAFGVSEAYMSKYGTQLENVYQKNLYDLVESVNNTDTKLGKILVSNDTDFQNKTLIEVSHNTELAEHSISALPISQGAISESITFINQVGGYTSTLAKKLAKGGKLSQSEKQTLSEIQKSIQDMKEQINDYIYDIQGDYSILQESLNIVGDENAFTIRISRIKDEGVDYPTMIYDGPFSDSETNVDIKGLDGEEVSKEQAYDNILNCFKNVNICTYEGEINSKIETYNFKLVTTTNHTLYIQVSKRGGNIITVSGISNMNQMDNFDMASAEKIALDFTKENGIENPICVWQDRLDNEGYFNIAPVQNGVILYPDLVKVKIDLSEGVVIGYDASTYFTNHTSRLLPKANITESDAAKILPEGYNFEKGRLVLAPLEYAREVLCYEFLGEKEGSTYYFYINAQNGKEENILKVIETTDGAKLM